MSRKYYRKTKAGSAKAQVQIALSLLKNTSRFEWFLEKATELGVSEIIPLKCARTEKQQFRMERLQGILESAMIQSQQVWMPVLHEPKNFFDWLWTERRQTRNLLLIANPEQKEDSSEMINTNLSSQLILIGPEGDFTEEEIKLALKSGFMPVELGENRLRSETAAVAAAAIVEVTL